MSADLVVQKAVRSRLVAAANVTSLVPQENILDRHARPAPDTSIILGESQSVDEGDIGRAQQRVYASIHIWKKENSLEGIKQIAGAVREAIVAGRPQLESGWHCADWKISDNRFLRDPDGETSHAVVTLEALVSEVGT